MWTILKLHFKDNEFYGKKDVVDICRAFEGISYSDFMPFIGDKYYVPKPAMITKGLLDLNIKDFKYHRVMKYIEITDLPDFFAGEFDFEKKSSLYFGQYILSEEVEKFKFVDGAGIYSVILPDEAEEILSRLKSRVEDMKDVCAIESTETDSISECVGDGHSKYWMTLGALNTKLYLPEQLSMLMKGSFYQVGRKKDRPGIFFLPGACFKDKADEILEKTPLLEMRL